MPGIPAEAVARHHSARWEILANPLLQRARTALLRIPVHPKVGNTRHFDNGIAGGLNFCQRSPAASGTHFNYSTHGYRSPDAQLRQPPASSTRAVREMVHIPAGMLQTRPDERFAIVPFRTRFYSKDQSGAVMNAEFLDASYKVPGGGWLSRARHGAIRGGDDE